MENLERDICIHCNFEINDEDYIRCYHCYDVMCSDCCINEDICEELEQTESIIYDFFLNEFNKFPHFRDFHKDNFLKEKKKQVLEIIDDTINIFKLDEIHNSIDIDLIYNKLYEERYGKQIREEETKNFLFVFNKVPSFQKIYDNDIPRNILQYII